MFINCFSSASDTAEALDFSTEKYPLVTVVTACYQKFHYYKDTIGSVSKIASASWTSA